ncbi:hypothetical protein CHS0354_019603 [Potamilus streckersoni]|uniref:Uncharacterized protein n=1 Tax=Potamilus streckersoni TaxID=2493646 RepID=A0AAE0T9T1_9BIVA|nr:hypothetical protein CHS0354_019603 [Potamilus streckersoni]
MDKQGNLAMKSKSPVKSLKEPSSQSRKMTGNTLHCSGIPYTPKGSSVGLLSRQAKQSSSTLDGWLTVPPKETTKLGQLPTSLHQRATSESPDFITTTKTNHRLAPFWSWMIANVATSSPKTNVALPLLPSLTAFPLFPIPSSQETKTTREVIASLSKLTGKVYSLNVNVKKEKEFDTQTIQGNPNEDLP